MSVRAIEESDCYLMDQVVFDKKDSKIIGYYYPAEDKFRTDSVFNALFQNQTDQMLYVANIATENVITKVLKEKGFELKKTHDETCSLFSLSIVASDPKHISTAIKTYRMLNGTLYAEQLQRNFMKMLEEEKNSIAETEAENLRNKLSDIALQANKEEKK